MITGWPSETAAGWVRSTGKNDLRKLAIGDQLSLGHGEMILTLTVTTVLAREANRLLHPAIPRDQWADLLIADLLESDQHVLRAPDFLRRARGLAKFHYDALRLTEGELTDARRRHLHR